MYIRYESAWLYALRPTGVYLESVELAGGNPVLDGGREFDGQAVKHSILLDSGTLELWLLEDMSLAVVSCVSVNYDHDGYITQYRTIKDTPVRDSELCRDLGELVEDLNGLCGPVYEHTQPFYEP